MELSSWSRMIEQLDQAILSVNSKGRTLWATQRARQLFAGEGTKSCATERLSKGLHDWIKAQERNLSTPSAIPRPPEPLKLELCGRQLRARLVHDSERRLIFLEEAACEISPVSLEHLGLSRRKTEILGWVAQGKSNPEIAAILGISVRTVHKHLERIYVKLGVENRHAATTLALEAVWHMTGHSGPSVIGLM